MSEPLTLLLAELPTAEPDAVWAERVRIRCRARLAQAPPALSRVSMKPIKSTRVWQPLIGALGVAYLADVIVQALRLYGVP